MLAELLCCVTPLDIFMLLSEVYFENKYAMSCYISNPILI
jgi:hypothetical protein